AHLLTGGSLRITEGVGSALPPPASLPADVRLNDPHIVPSGVNQPRFPVFFPRNDESDAVSGQNRRDRRRFEVGTQPSCCAVSSRRCVLEVWGGKRRCSRVGSGCKNQLS